MADHICKPGFCRSCHCRRITSERQADPTYFAKKQAGLNRWADSRVGIPINDEERKLLPILRNKGLDAKRSRLVIIRSRPTSQQEGK